MAVFKTSLHFGFIFLFLCPFFLQEVIGNDQGEYVAGIGIADVTGPAAGVNMMGYANPSQKTGGIHTRLYSRAFYFESKDDPTKCVVFVSVDIGMVDQAVKTMVIRKLGEKFDKAIFNTTNVLLSGTHTHSGPAAYLQYFMYGITSQGFLDSSFYAIVDGIVESIENAYVRRQPIKLFLNSGDVENANINRSPSAYEANPEDERAEYGRGNNVDKLMTLMRIERANDSTPLGSVNWFAVHPTSMNNTNRLISGDNKGYASMLMEAAYKSDSSPVEGFVAAFASSNLGDVSPNIEGAKCIAGPDIGKNCSLDSLCNGKVQDCIASGPGKDMEESTEIIGRRQFEKAKELFDAAATPGYQIKGDVRFIHQNVDISKYTFTEIDPTLLPAPQPKTTCLPALGYSFAAGTTDGPGMFDFKQGELTGNPFWDMVSGFLKKPTQDLITCHKPKPILLPVGETDFPYEWVPFIVETQIIKVGNLFIVGVPGELTTMAGRRLRKIIKKAVTSSDFFDPRGPDPVVVIAGLSNVYTHYITTHQEYQVQRYEAASTLYGPDTLGAYLAQYKLMTDAMMKDEKLDSGPEAPDYIENAGKWSLIPALANDESPESSDFGDVLVQPQDKYKRGSTVSIKFVGGHPRHNTMRGGTFLVVERGTGDERWTIVATDADWSTKFHWSRPEFGSKQSIIEITWKIPADAPIGKYRIRHFGYFKTEEEPKNYEGKSNEFEVE